MPYELFDRSLLELKPLSERVHDLSLETMLDPWGEIPAFSHPALDVLAGRIRAARSNGAAVIFMMGAHVIRSGVSRFLIELMKEGWVTHVAMNGAGAIHDFELSLIGQTTESVARYIREGQFGLWKETGRINDAAVLAVKEGMGLGEAIGKMIEEEAFPHRDVSVLAAGYRCRVPVTVHVGIGCDIVHEHPNCDGAALGQSSYTDFLVYANTISHLENGVFLNFGSAVIGPEVYLKCLAMARNVAHRQGRKISRFTTAVFDLLPLEDVHTGEAPDKSDPRYYFRPWKTILARTVAEGGESFYICGEHRKTVSNLARLLMNRYSERTEPGTEKRDTGREADMRSKEGWA